MMTQFKKGVLEMCVLALINQKDRYGYEIVELISKHIEVTEGTIYPILRRIVAESFATTYLKESNAGPPRKYYTITDSGRDRYYQQLNDWAEFTKNVVAITTMEAEHDEE